MSPDVTRADLDRHVHSRLRTRIRLYLGISIAIIIAILYRVIVDGGGILYPLVAFAAGVAVGIILSRMFNVSWDKDAEKVVSRMDIYGAAFLVAYIIFEFSGEHFIEQWFSGPEVLTVILSLAGGAVLGRGLGMAGRMLRVLRSHIPGNA